jgi:phage terminase large subunit-like protein
MPATTAIDCPPREGTARTPRRRTYGPQVAAVARQLGFRPMPWQRLVLSVALERAGHRPAYRDVLVSVPRQSGKTSLCLALLVWRMLEVPNTTVAYAAQSRLAARDKLLSDFWPIIQRSELAGRFSLYRAFGAESMTADNGSRLVLLSSGETSGHGATLDLAVIDEAWKHQDATVEQAVRPTMLTRSQAQLWICSTAGTAKSVWWRGKLDAAREAAAQGVTDGVALLEWAAPLDADPTAEATWWAAMPALGRTVDPAVVRADLLAMGVKEFRRACLNLWPDESETGWAVISHDDWEATAVEP